MKSEWDMGFGDYHSNLNQFSGVWHHKENNSIKITILKILLNNFGDKQFYFTYIDCLGVEYVISLKELYSNFERIVKFNIE